MSWMQKLYETYEKAQKIPGLSAEDRILPVSHLAQQAHVEIVLDGEGNFISAQVVEKEETLVPVTEDSAGRSSGGAPHPLCDKIQYVAGDYPDFGGKKSSYFEDFKSGKDTKAGYLSLLTQWTKAFPHPKLQAILNYVEKRHVVADLVRAKVLHVDAENRLLTAWPDDNANVPGIFKVLAKKKERGVSVQDQGDAFVRWCVHIPSDPEVHAWKDERLIESWIRFDADLQEKQGLCLITGEKTTLGTKHPARIRHGGDKAKLVSANDLSGYTFLGRFTDAEQACSISYEVSQKAHAALRWLVKRQAFRNEDQVVVAWDVAGERLPPVAENSLYALFPEMEEEEIGTPMPEERLVAGDLGQEYALRLKKKIAGYRTKLDERSDIVVMGLDSSTPGRMAITFYRELDGSEFLSRLEDWHLSYAWPQYHSKELQFTGAPAPKEIAAAAFGRRLDSKLGKATVNRVLPCIVDGLPIPEDLVRSTRSRATNRVGMEYWEWEKTLGIACGLFRGFHKKEGYKMALEKERTSRDYLYGRLLAVAERMEAVALGVAGEIRDTNAAKLMQRFSERPYSTWLQIEQSLVPYKTRLQSRRPAFLNNMTALLDEIHCMFDAEEYMKDTPLSGEFLLAYHCQRRDLRSKTKDATEVGDLNTNTDEEE